MIDELLKFFVVLFVVVEPPSLVPLFATMTVGASPVYARRMAVKASIIAALILIAFGLGGGKLIRLLGISIDAFRIGGGIMLFLIALEMVFARGAGRGDRAGDHRDADVHARRTAVHARRRRHRCQRRVSVGRCHSRGIGRAVHHRRPQGRVRGGLTSPVRRVRSPGRRRYGPVAGRGVRTSSAAVPPVAQRSRRPRPGCETRHAR